MPACNTVVLLINYILLLDLLGTYLFEVFDGLSFFTLANFIVLYRL